MRHGVVAAGSLLLVLTLGSWIVGSPSTTGSTTVSGSRTPAAVPTTQAPAEATPATRPRVPPVPVAVANSSAEPPVVVSAPPPRATAAETAATFLDEVGRLRRASGLGRLARDAALDEMAQDWAETLAADGALRHSDLIHDVIEGSWTTAGENVGYGPSATLVFEALEASPAHLANMVNPDFVRMGIGVVWVDDVVWTAHLFAG